MSALIHDIGLKTRGNRHGRCTWETLPENRTTYQDPDTDSKGSGTMGAKKVLMEGKGQGLGR